MYTERSPSILVHYILLLKLWYPASVAPVQDEPNKRARPAQRRVLRARILEQEVDRMKAGSRVLAAASSLSLGRCTRAR